MKNPRSSQSFGSSGVAMIAAAVGAVAVGAFAIGALAIGRLAIRYVAIGGAKFRSLEIEEPTVKRPHTAELTVSDSFKLPGGEFGHDNQS